MSRKPVLALSCVLIVVAALAACRPANPLADALRQRSRFTVELLSWVPRDDGRLSFSVRVTGPPSTSLSNLSFLVAQIDAEGNELTSEWLTVDLVNVPRGAPKEMFFSVISAEGAVEGLTAQIVLNPSESQIADIPELRDL